MATLEILKQKVDELLAENEGLKIDVRELKMAQDTSTTLLTEAIAKLDEIRDDLKELADLDETLEPIVAKIGSLSIDLNNSRVVLRGETADITTDAESVKSAVDSLAPSE